MLRWIPGYEASQLNHKGEHPMGFALFSTPHLAIAAKDALQVNQYLHPNILVVYYSLHTYIYTYSSFLSLGYAF